MASATSPEGAREYKASPGRRHASPSQAGKKILSSERRAGRESKAAGVNGKRVKRP